MAGFGRFVRKRNADGKFSPMEPFTIPRDSVFQVWARVLTVLIESEGDGDTPQKTQWIEDLRKIQQGRTRAKQKRIIEVDGPTRDVTGVSPSDEKKHVVGLGWPLGSPLGFPP